MYIVIPSEREESQKIDSSRSLRMTMVVKLMIILIQRTLCNFISAKLLAIF